MIAQWLKEEGRQEGFQQGNVMLLSRLFRKKFRQDFDEFRPLLDGLRPEDLLELGEYLLECQSVDDLRSWIEQRKQGNLS